MVDPSTHLKDGFFYRIQGPNNLVLCDFEGRATLYAHPGVDTPGIECWRARWTDDRGWAFQNWDTGRTLRATAPARTGGRPVPPPERGAPVYLIDGLDDGLRYSLWALQPQTLRDKYALQANNCLPTDTPMVLNVKGNDWEMQTAEMITWEWSGGQPNEIWWFQELHPQPTPQWD